jgi:hypothetical protein
MSKYSFCLSPKKSTITVPLRLISGKIGTEITFRLAGREHTLRQAKSPIWGQEIPMEVAAFVLLSSIALWFAEEISRNQL